VQLALDFRELILFFVLLSIFWVVGFLEGFVMDSFFIVFSELQELIEIVVILLC
jgi:hypothetical protein